MIEFNESEERFIKRAIVSTKKDLEDLDLNAGNKKDLLKIIDTFKASGYVCARSIDGGKDFNIWRIIKEKLDDPIPDPRETILKHARERAEGIAKRIEKAHDITIEKHKKQYEQALQDKEDALRENELKIQKEVEGIDIERQEALQRLEIAKMAREKISRNKKYKKKHDHEEDGNMDKCWECGEWFKSGAGISSHIRARHPELKSD